MNCKKAFLITLREKLYHITPLERILISCMSRKLIQESWKDIQPFSNNCVVIIL